MSIQKIIPTVARELGLKIVIIKLPSCCDNKQIHYLAMKTKSNNVINEAGGYNGW